MSPHDPPNRPVCAAGAVIVDRGKVLLVKRENPPDPGSWALPGGKQRAGETLAETVRREVREETGLTVRTGALIDVFDLIDRDETGALRHHFTIVNLLAQVENGRLQAGDDAREARFFALDDVLADPPRPAVGRDIRHMIARGVALLQGRKGD